MGAVGVVTLLLCAIQFAKRYERRYAVALPTPPARPRESLAAFLGWALQSRAVGRRVVVTGVVVALVQLLRWIPLAGMEPDAAHAIERMGPLVPLFAEEFPWHVTAVGILPFITACLYLQVGSLFLPVVRRWHFGGPTDRRKLVCATYFLAFLIAGLQAYGLTVGAEEIGVFAAAGLPVRCLHLCPLVVGFALLLCAAHCIQRYGIGNGIAVLVVANLLRDLPATGMSFWQSAHGPLPVVFVACCGGVFLYWVYRVTVAACPVTLTIRGGGEPFTVPLRFSIVATEPVTWAASLVLLPITIAQFFPTVERIYGVLQWWPVHFCLTIGCVAVMTALYAAIVFRSKGICERMERYGFTLVEPNGLPCRRYWDRRMARLLLVSLLLFFVLSVLPDVLAQGLVVPMSTTFLFGAGGFLICVGFWCDLIAQCRFLRARETSGRDDWMVARIAGDEIEAEMDAVYLQGKGIPVLIEPLRFTWGMPIRTIVDQYRIYTPAENVTVARNLL